MNKVKNESELINRRNALKKTAFILGGVVSGPTIAGIMHGCTVTNEPDWIPELFSEKQALLITEIVDTIIPSTDTPGAKDVGVPKFIESMVMNVFTKEEREKFIDNLRAFSDRTVKEKGVDFMKLQTQEKYEYLMAVHEEEAMNPEMQLAFMRGFSNPGENGKPIILTIKELTVGGYCTSEVGATQILKYDKLPGEWHSCIPFDQVGRAWYQQSI